MPGRKNVGATVHIVDDDESFRVATERLLQAAAYQVRSYASGADFAGICQMSGRTGLACVLLDIHLPGPDGIDLYERFTGNADTMPAVFISGRGDVPMSVRAMKAGAVDFLTKPIRKETLLRAVAMALEKDAASLAQRDKLQRTRRLFETLSARERSVFHGLVAGKLNKQMAAEIGAGERTIKAYRRRVLEKMKAGSVADLVRCAVVLGGSLPQASPPDASERPGLIN